MHSVMNLLRSIVSGFKSCIFLFVSCTLATSFVSHQALATKIFVYCSEASPSSFNPQLATDGTTYNASSGMIYNRLVEFKPGETTLISALASEVPKASKDGMKYIFKLRKGVKFHTTPYFKPTRDFNADDVLFSFNRQRLKDHPFHKVGGGSYEYFDSMEMGIVIKDIKKIDDYTVEFDLSRPEAPFLANLAMDFASILSKEYADAMLKAGTPDKMDVLPIGTGPFIYKDYVKDNSIRYTAHPDYFRGKSPLETVVFAITPDASVRIQKLKTNECQFATEPSPADLATVKKDPNLKIMEQPGLNVAYLAMNVKKKPFDNLYVRQAINHALNRKSYIDAIYLGNAVVAKNPLPPTIWSYNKSIQDYDYNPEKAKELLKKAGLPNGFSVDLWAMPVSRPYNPNGKKMGEMMQADLEKIGVHVKIVSFDWPTYLARSKKGEHELIQMGWTGDNGDPDNFLAVLLGCSGVEAGSNLANWCDKSFEKKIGDAKIIADPKARTQLYLAAQKIFKEQAPWVTLAHSTVHRAMRKNVEGYKLDPFGKDSFYGVDLK